MLKVQLIDGDGKAVIARVNEDGELVTGALRPSDAISKELDTDDTPVNFFVAKAKSRIRITGIILSAPNNIGVNGSQVTIYRSDGPNSSTVLGDILTVNVGRQDTVPVTALNLDIVRGSFVNAQADDTPVNLTIIATEIPVIE